jgi:hypothetical protein
MRRVARCAAISSIWFFRVFMVFSVSDASCVCSHMKPASAENIKRDPPEL